VKRRRKQRLSSEINVVPYLDVLLVLLVIFMISAPVLQQGQQVELPQAQSNELSEEDSPPLLVTINLQGQTTINQGPNAGKPLNQQQLSQAVAQFRQQSPEAPIYVQGDRQLTYQALMTVMTWLQQAGAGQVGLLTTPEPSVP